ncbi:MAG: FlgD immunoglobulin-like domain containing protein, partial [bacterium]
TSCNSGTVNVPWFAAMQENHPAIGLALFRLSASGTLEMIGQNYMKHGFYALSNDQCSFGCQGGGNGTYLLVDCSDTYSSGHNGDRYHLGPRSELDPVTGIWEACGSYFDDWNTPDGDCARDYFGNEPNGALHRIEVHDSDLGNPGALYYYEGEYVVRNDSRLENSVGWRRCTMSWSGSSWQFQTVGGGLTPTYGPYINTWGDEHVEKKVGDSDGAVILATKVDDLGGGEWHYEYALYNWWSERGVRSISVPIGAATISNVGFHDLDQDAGNDWTVDVSGGEITWSTDDYATDPDAHALFYQTMFNFRFDANVASEPGTVAIEPFKPGAGSITYIDVQTPPSSATAVLAGPSVHELAIACEPNPFRERTDVDFTLAEGRAVRLDVVDVAGRVVRVLVDGEAPAGSNRVVWDGRNDGGDRLASGVYFFRLDAGEQNRVLKATLLR